MHEKVAVNLKKSIISAIFAVGMMVNALAHEVPSDSPAGADRVGMESVPAAAPLAARYRLKSGSIDSDWYLWRDNATVETADLATGQNTIWEKLGRDDYRYRRVFNREQRVVDYSPGEIRTRNGEPDWPKLESVVSPQLLAALRRGESRPAFGQTAAHYSGTIKGQQIDLWWLEQARLPMYLEIVSAGRHLAMTLQALHDRAPADWPRATGEKIADYGQIDAADFGDMENDPFVARVMQQGGSHRGHEH